MTTPTPATLAEALSDFARSYTNPPPCMQPNPALGDYISQMASRTTDRIRDDDPRLASFEGVTDPTGYPWLSFEPESAETEVVAQAAAEQWPFEQALTALAQAIKGTVICGVEGLSR